LYGKRGSKDDGEVPAPLSYLKKQPERGNNGGLNWEERKCNRSGVWGKRIELTEGCAGPRPTYSGYGSKLKIGQLRHKGKKKRVAGKVATL